MASRTSRLHAAILMGSIFGLACPWPAVAADLVRPKAVEATAEPDLWEREKLTGDWGGARTALSDKGIEIGIAYIGETFGVLSGGLRRGATYEGRLDVTIDTDLEKLMGWTGAKTQVRAFQIHSGSNGNAADYVGSIADPSNIDGLSTTRLFTAWFQQEFGTWGSLRIGQLAADDEFLTSTTAGGLINGTFGWATMMSGNLPSGGPAYPLATPGVRLQVNPNDRISLLAAVFSGDPAGKDCFDDNPQSCNRHGVTFSTSGGAFWIGEAQYQVNQGKDATGLAAAYKLGVWYHSGDFADQRFGVDANGVIVSLVNADGELLHRGNWGVYGVIDQMIWRSGTRSASVFVRGGVSPSDRNAVAWYIDGGVGIKGALAGRPDDVVTLGVAHSHISDDAAALDRDTLALNGPPYPIRNGETVIELSYTYQVAPWWTLQPDLQYIVRPGGHVPNPDDPNQTVDNAWLVGLRTTVTF
jgi:porin